ncbi:hypothetical protein QPK87_27960 [Kamptonema cortianum]|nr:hypothetical protein [Geitlerinema splendidum]MDK3160363.1 hypothetical protein [Kamptonema cortianum]
MLTTLLVGLLLAPDERVSDYYPLVPGSKWTYEEVTKIGRDKFTRIYTDRVGEAVEINDQKAIPIFSKGPDGSESAIYHMVTESAVWVVAFDPAKPLPNPYPILQVSGSRERWVFEGMTQFMHDFVPMKLEGNSYSGGTKTVLGDKLSTMWAETKAVIQAAETGTTAMFASSESKALYAKGIGLVEMTSKETIGKTKSERTRKIVSYSSGVR